MIVSVLCAETSRTKLYFVSPAADWFLFGGGSLVLFAAALSAPWVLDHVAAYWGAFLLIVVNWPHFSATIHRLYRSRETVASYPFAALVLPFFMAAVIAAALWRPGLFAPALVKLYFLWSPYHFCGQSLGVALVFAHRSGMRLGRGERRALDAFMYGTFLLSTAKQETMRGVIFFRDISYPTLGIPPWVSDVALSVVVIAGAVFAAGMAKRWFLRNEKMPAIFYLPIVCQLVWFVFSARFPVYFGLVPFFHGLQYLPFVWFMHLEQNKRAGSLRTESVLWGVKNIVGGVVLFVGLPFLVSVIAGAPLVFVQAVMWVAINVHHFIVDGVIWKLRRPEVGRSLAQAPAWPPLPSARLVPA